MDQEFDAKAAVARIETRLAEIESRIRQLELFTGIDDFDAAGMDSLHRRVDRLEDWQREQYQGG